MFITKTTNTMKELISYENGNTTVTILEDGTKIREYKSTPYILHPESIDVKITNYCDMGCKYCHESSTTAGKHGDVDNLLEVLSELPRGVELAIGGGNPLSHPRLIELLEKLKNKGFISNITVNQGHLKRYQDLLKLLIKEDLFKGIGISVTNNNFKYVEPLVKLSNNIVYHLIAGINNVYDIDKLIEISGEHTKVLLLGYKTFGFGKAYYSPEVLNNLKQWYRFLPSVIGRCTLSFDNLAIDQLKVRRLFTKEGWDRFYMGDDFCFTMYIDAVNQDYAPTSRSSNRISCSDMSLLEYFKKHKNS